MKTHGKVTVRPASAKARRRSQRVALRYALVAYSYSETTGKMRFREGTHTVRVSAHGGLIPLDAPLTFGEMFMLKHATSLDEHPCRVVFVSPDNKTGKNLVGFEFTKGDPDFWHVYFPPTNGKASTPSVSNGNAGSFYSHD